ncbi:MAG: hypothetical protein V9H69_22910 [Anaerolineae bacterium]
MTTSDAYKEEISSQIPALQLLIALGWQYLTPDEALHLRGGRREERGADRRAGAVAARAQRHPTSRARRARLQRRQHRRGHRPAGQRASARACCSATSASTSCSPWAPA